MAEPHARLKALVSRHVRAAEAAWRAAYGPDIPPPDWPRYVYRVLCGQVFPATGNPEPCSQVLGIAVPGPLFEKIAVVQLAVQHAEDGSIPDPTAWFLTASRAHIAKEPDGTYAPHPQRTTDRPGWRRSRVPRVMGSETGRWSIGRRPLPPQLLANLEQLGFPLDIDGTRTVIGHFPPLPCRVRCPRCRQVNVVDSPEPVDWRPDDGQAI
jgi:hypothetical protein